jgi:hypothetical protein
VLELNSNDAEGSQDGRQALPSQSDWAAPFEARDHRLVDARTRFKVELSHEGAES